MYANLLASLHAKESSNIDSDAKGITTKPIADVEPGRPCVRPLLPLRRALLSKFALHCSRCEQILLRPAESSSITFHKFDHTQFALAVLPTITVAVPDLRSQPSRISDSQTDVRERPFNLWITNPLRWAFLRLTHSLRILSFAGKLSNSQFGLIASIHYLRGCFRF
jgi:hypothetical protein